MIDSVRGNIIKKLPTYIVLDVNGVGYGIHVPLSTYSALKDGGPPVEIHTLVFIRDDTPVMFGFYTREEKALFSMLIGVSGVGPRTALGILSAFSAVQFTEAVINEDAGALLAVPGIGKKTAGRLILELKDRLEPLTAERAGEPAGTAAPGSLSADAATALAYLGCGAREAAAAVKKARARLPETAGLEDIIKEALKQL